MKTRTFSPPTSEKAFVYSQLCKNIEKACARARGMGMRAKEVSLYLKTQEFLYGRREIVLLKPTADPRDIVHAVDSLFDALFLPGVLYRATGITLRNLIINKATTSSLFADLSAEGKGEVFTSIDAINRRFGRETIFLGASSQAIHHKEPDRRGGKAKRKAHISMSVEQKKKTIDLPFLGLVH